jgi:hypothetical protein
LHPTTDNVFASRENPNIKNVQVVKPASSKLGATKIILPVDKKIEQTLADKCIPRTRQNTTVMSPCVEGISPHFCPTQKLRK